MLGLAHVLDQGECPCGLGDEQGQASRRGQYMDQAAQCGAQARRQPFLSATGDGAATTSAIPGPGVMASTRVAKMKASNDMADGSRVV